MIPWYYGVVLFILGVTIGIVLLSACVISGHDKTG